MDLSTISVADFKAQFSRDFPYLPTYDASKLYNANAIVYYSTNQLFYKCLVDGVIGVVPGTNPAIWELYPDDVLNYVLDDDINKAFAEALVSFNQGLFTTDANIKLGFLYLSAHYLVNDINAAQAGIGGIGSFPVTSRSVGSVSESYAVPQRYMDDPVLAFYAKSAYGMKYINLVLPRLAGNMVAVWGGTNP